jgi:hypothetical protein
MKNQKDVLQVLKDKQYTTDDLGRIVIDDPEMLSLIKGSAGFAPGLDSLWNGACSNDSCAL